jgi:ABC-type siderophore export system fused ATPase/permease subunit
MVTHDSRYLAQVGRTVHLFDGRLVERVPLDREVA